MDKQIIINAIAALRSAVQSGERMSESLNDMANAALNEVRKAPSEPAPAKSP
jgi:hypothetical protein